MRRDVHFVNQDRPRNCTSKMAAIVKHTRQVRGLWPINSETSLQEPMLICIIHLQPCIHLYLQHQYVVITKIYCSVCSSYNIQIHTLKYLQRQRCS